MNRPKEGEYWAHKSLQHDIFIVAVGIRNVLATERIAGDIYEDMYSIPTLMEWYERKESSKS